MGPSRAHFLKLWELRAIFDLQITDMKTALPDSINNAQEAKDFIHAMCDNDEIYHLDDPASDLVPQLFTQEEADKVQDLVMSCFDHLEDPFEVILDRLAENKKI